MQAEVLEQFNKFYSASCAAQKQLDQLSVRLWGEFAQQQMELMKLWAQWGEREFQVLTSGKGPTELFTAQSSIATEFSAKLIDHFREATTSMAGTAREAIAGFGWPELVSAVIPPTERAEKPAREEAVKARKSAA